METMQTTSLSSIQDQLDPIHFVLAYAGMILHLLTKLGEVYNHPEFSMNSFVKRNVIATIISIIGIPVLLIVATDTAMSEFLPINYVTSVLAGWQTQSLFKSMFTMYGNRKGLQLQNVTGSETQTNATTPTDPQ